MSAPSLEIELRGNVGSLKIDFVLSAPAGLTVIVGPNGAGKTSLLMMILGALPPESGRVLVDGVAVFDRARGIDLPVEQRGIGFLPQRDTLFPHLDVLENVVYGIADAPRAERDRRALAALRELGAEALASRRPDGLSGGEAQRVALARALAPAPRALLLDEPLAALDVGLRREVRTFLAAHLRRLAIPTLVVTHDRADAEAFDGEIVVMEGGAIVQRGRLADLVARPATDFVRQFLVA